MCPSPSITLCMCVSPSECSKDCRSGRVDAEEGVGVAAADPLQVVTGQAGHSFQDGAGGIGHERIVGTDDDPVTAHDLEHELEGVGREDEEVDEDSTGE